MLWPITDADLKRHQMQKVTRNECALTAFALGLGPFVQCGNAAATKDVLAEAFEAVLGAVFHDGGYSAAATFWQQMQAKVDSLRLLASQSCSAKAASK